MLLIPRLTIENFICRELKATEEKRGILRFFYSGCQSESKQRLQRLIGGVTFTL